MGRLAKRLGIFSLLVAITGVIFFPYNSYSGLIISSIKDRSRQAGIVADIGELQIAFPLTLNLNDVGFVFPGPGFFLPLHLDKLTISPRYFQLLLIRATLTADSKAYQGTITSDLSRSFFGSQFNLTAKGEKLRLEEYPLFKNYGAGGELSFSFAGRFDSLTDPPPTLQSSQLSIDITQGSIKGGPPIAGVFPLPSVSNIAINCRATSDNEQLRLTQFSVTSSIGKASGSGTLMLKQGSISNGNIRFRINLNEAGRTAIGGYLALAAQMPVDTPETDWQVEISFRPSGSPRVNVGPA